jgi:hypothetical protein
MDRPAETHQFDFWLGSWNVFDPDDQLVGTSRITALFGGVALMEEWEGKGLVSGRSLNSWDAGRQAWHQTWMDSSGSTLLLDGGLRDASMVLEGSAPSERHGGPWDRHRITWTPSRDRAEVRQLWETSQDGGVTWSVAFDGRYRRSYPQ